MFIIPFFLRNSLPSLCAWKLFPITVFLENRGKSLYKLDNHDDPEEWLEQNGFVKKSCWKENDFYFVEIDPKLMKLNEFYSYEQLTVQQAKGTEDCWRTFFIMKTKEENDPSLKSWNELIEPEFNTVFQKIKVRML